jgi:hypothetical protein
VGRDLADVTIGLQTVVYLVRLLTVDEMAEQMRLFARYVIPAFPEKPRTAASRLSTSAQH